MNMKAKIRKTGEIVDVITYSGHFAFHSFLSLLRIKLIDHFVSD